MDGTNWRSWKIELTIRLVNEPLVHGVHKILLMSAKTMIRTADFHYRNMVFRRCAFEESVSHVRVCQGVSQAMDDENWLENMADDIMNNLRLIISRNERALITTITKRASEELTEFLASN